MAAEAKRPLLVYPASTTRPDRYSRKRPLEVGGVRSRDRFSAKERKDLKSVAAIGVYEALGMADLAARIIEASQDFKWQKTDEYKKAILALNRDKSISPSQREERRKIIGATSRTYQREQWRRDRLLAKRLIKIIREYVINRDWLDTHHALVRINFIRRLAAEAENVQRNFVPSANQEDARRRSRNIRELGRDNKRRRKVFGWRGRSEGRKAYLSRAVSGSFDPVECAEAAIFAALGEQKTENADHGLTLRSFRGEEGWQSGVAGTEEWTEYEGMETFEKLLRCTVQEFRELKTKGE
jgi:hypothetical protein